MTVASPARGRTPPLHQSKCALHRSKRGGFGHSGRPPEPSTTLRLVKRDQRRPTKAAPSGTGLRRGPARAGAAPSYLTVTVAPAPSRAALAFSAASLLTFSRTGFGRAVDEVLGLLQAEAGERAHLLDDLDLLVAGRLEDDVELVLLLGLGRGGAAAGRRGGGHGDRGGRGDAEGRPRTASRTRESSIRVISLNASRSSSVLSFAMVAVLPVCGPARSRGSVTQPCGVSSVDVSLVLAVALGGGSADSSAGSADSSACICRLVGGACPLLGGLVDDRGLGWGLAAARRQGGPRDGRRAGSAGEDRRVGLGLLAWSARPGGPPARAGVCGERHRRLSDACMPAASFARRTSRDSRSASLAISAASSGFPSRTPPLMTRAGLALGEVTQTLGRLDGVTVDERDGRRAGEQVVESPRRRPRGRRSWSGCS